MAGAGAGFACLTRSICQKWSDNNNNSNTRIQLEPDVYAHTRISMQTYVCTDMCVVYLCIYIMYLVLSRFGASVCFFWWKQSYQAEQQPIKAFGKGA